MVEYRSAVDVAEGSAAAYIRRTVGDCAVYKCRATVGTDIYSATTYGEAGDTAIADNKILNDRTGVDINVYTGATFVREAAIDNGKAVYDRISVFAAVEDKAAAGLLTVNNCAGNDVGVIRIGADQRNVFAACADVAVVNAGTNDKCFTILCRVNSQLDSIAST